MRCCGFDDHSLVKYLVHGRSVWTGVVDIPGGRKHMNARSLLRMLCCLVALFFVSSLGSAVPAETVDGSVGVSYREGKVSIDSRQGTLLNVFENLAEKTPYAFVIPEEILERPVTMKCYDLELEDSIRRILDAAGVQNYALVYGFTRHQGAEQAERQNRVMLMGDAGQRGGYTVSKRRLGSAVAETPIGGGKKTALPSDGATGGSTGLGTGRISDGVAYDRDGDVPKEGHNIPGDMSAVPVPLQAESIEEDMPTLREVRPGSKGFPVYERFELEERPTKFYNVNPSSESQ
jgi:hypothetical protein